MADIACIEGNEDSELSFYNLTCGKCNEEFTHDKPARLLHCLHSFCESCLDEHSKSLNEQNREEENGESSSSECQLTCPDCKTVYTTDLVTVNPFVNISKKPEPRTEDGSPSESKFPICTSCDDNQKASSFCSECQENLCDPCVIAHKRVRITKDHNISNQIKSDQVQDGSSFEAKHRQMYCKIHKLEQLKLFCLTCETLTCRDCQLLEHKDHKYQFIEQTIEEQKNTLKGGVTQLKERLSNNKALSEKMSDKEKDIKKQQVEVFNEVRQVADSITNELISWCKQLLNFLQTICHSRMRDLTYKKKEVDTFAKRASHTIKFVEAALASDDDLAVLYAKSFMSKSIKTLQDQTILVPNTLFDLNIKYENEAKFLAKNVSKMGFINLNGKPYPQLHQEQRNAKSPTPTNSAPQKLTPEAINKNIAGFLSKHPQHVREQYSRLSEEKRKLFLQTLMQRHMQKNKTQQQQQQQQQQQPLYGQPPNVRPGGNFGPYHTDSGAIQDLYSIHNNHPQHHVRPRGTYYPENTLQRQMTPGSTPLQHRLGHPNQTIQPQGPSFQQWRGTGPSNDWVGGASSYEPTQLGILGPNVNQSLQNLQQLTNRHMTLGRSAPLSNQIKGAPSVQPPSAQNAPTFIPGNKLPEGRFDIDPLNLRGQPNLHGLRIKQEPKENASCKLSGGPSSVLKVPPSPTTITPTPSYGSQGFTPSADSGAGLQSPPPNSIASPSLTPSPCHSDGAPAKSASPATTDITLAMDNDRNELLKGLSDPLASKNQYHLQPNHDPNDPSEDYCRVCHNGGDLLCCDKCPKVFHLHCHIPAISNTLGSETWTCTMCSPDDDLKITTPIPREFEVNSNGKRKAPNGLVDKELKVCERVLLELFCLEISTVFHEPVPKSVPNYHKVVQTPMDFSSIKYKLRRGHFGHYNTVEEFLSDIKLVFRNCYKFNPPTSEIYQVGKSVEAYFESLVNHFLPCYVPYLSRRTPSPTPAATLDNNGSDAQKPKKRRSPAPDNLDADGPQHMF